MSVFTPDTTILGLLAARRRHGYQLLDCFNDPQHLGRVWRLSTSQLYNLLKRLERESLITGEEIPSEIGPPRVEYALTELGRQKVMDWLNDSSPATSIRRVRLEFLSRLYVARELGLPITAIVQCQREVCLRERDRAMAERAFSASDIERLALDFKVSQFDAVLQWIDRCDYFSHTAN